MMKICCPAGILFVLVPAVDCVLVAVPGNMISEKIIQPIFRVLNMLGYRVGVTLPLENSNLSNSCC